MKKNLQQGSADKIYFSGKSIPKKDIPGLTPKKFPAGKIPKKVLALVKKWKKGKKSFLLHTSGSAGKSKPYAFTREQIRKSAQMTISQFGLKPGDHFLMCLDPGYVAGFMMVMRSLVGNAGLLVKEPQRNPLEHWPPQWPSPDFAAFVPMQLEAILENTPEKISLLNRMKTIIIGGSPGSSSLANQLKRISAPVYQTFGMTETLTHVAIKRLNGKFPDSAYKALPGVEFNISRDNCLVISTPVLIEPLITTDIVKLRSSKEFEWLGRKDHVINTGGVKVHPEKTEERMMQIPSVTEIGNKQNFFITSLPDKTYGEKVVLVIEGKTLATRHKESILNLLKEKLAPYECPKMIYHLEHFEYTRSGKIHRKATKDQLMNSVKGNENEEDLLS